MKYILTGGGTGGHVYPALAIAEHIKKNEPDAEFLYIGTKDHIESRIVPAKGFKMKYITATGMPDKKLSAAMLSFSLKIFYGTLKSLFIVSFYRPDMIIGSGGFVSAPPIFAGYILRKLKLSKTKLFLHEANAEPGKLIKLAGPLCDGVGVSYEIAMNLFPGNGKFVGYPVRPEFFSGSKSESRKKLGIAEDTFLVFAVGGSQGARTINRSVADSLKHLSGLKNFSIIHVTGRQNPNYNGLLDTIKRLEKNGIKESEIPFYKKIEYADNIKDYYFSADLIITRGGGTINEIAVCGTPSLIIPKANLSGDHQVMNALSMKNSGAADVVYEEVMIEDGEFIIKVEGEKLAGNITEFYNDRSRLEKMSSSAKKSVIANANDEIYKFIKDIFNNKKTAHAKTKIHQANKYADMGVKHIYNSLTKMKPEEISSLEFLDYIKYRTSHYLISKNWKVKNTAVKIAGLTKDRTKLPFLSKLLNEKNTGFVRRNIFCAYREIGVYNEMIEKDIFIGLNDPYWEVQTEALKLIKFFSEETKHNDKIKPVISGLLKTGNYEVILNAIDTFSIFIITVNDLREYDKFRYHNNSQIREAVISVMTDIKKKGIISADQFKAELDNILLTTSGFTPVFSMKQKLKDAL